MNKTALDQYEEIVTDALKSCSAKLRKSFKTAFIQLMILYMVLPRKINFTQMGRYSDSSEQRFRQLFEREFDRMQFNLFLMRQRFGESTRKAIAIDASYISKSGKKTPYIGKFWSGCASAMKRGLEILGIGIVDIDSRDCMMLCAEQTPDKAYLEKQGEEYNLVDWYLDVLRKYRDKLLDITRYIVADAWFSKAKFVNEACLLGFHVISRLRDDAALWYSHDGVRTGKRGRPRIKGEKIDFFFPSIIVFPYSDKTFIYRIIYIIMCMLLLFVIWRYYSVQDLIVSFSGGAFALVGSSVLASLLKKISK